MRSPTANDRRAARVIRVLLIALGLTPLLTVGCRSSLVAPEPVSAEHEHPARKNI